LNRLSGLQSRRMPTWLESIVLSPIRAYRREYLPVLLVYLAYGAMGVISVSETFWIKNYLGLTAAELAAVGVWLTLPWTMKMAVGELVDSVPLFASRRRSYIILGGGLVAAGLIFKASIGLGFLAPIPAGTQYLVASLIVAVGLVVQDVVADAMTVEVVPRVDECGRPRPPIDIQNDLSMVQALGRLALAFGIVLVAGLSGVFARWFSYSMVCLGALLIPFTSIAGTILIKNEPTDRRHIDWPILVGAIVLGCIVLAFANLGIPYAQEIAFVISLTLVGIMLARVLQDTHQQIRRTIWSAVIIIFAFRAAPEIGSGYVWYAIDVLKFDELFLGLLSQIGAVIGFAGVWALSRTISKSDPISVLFVMTIVTTMVFIPTLSLTLGVHNWTAQHLGFGPHFIALLDTTITAPFTHLSMVPILALCAIHAPATRRATWFALMASLLNLAVTAGGLQTKYINTLIVIERGSYQNLPMLVMIVMAMGLVLPLIAIVLLRPKSGNGLE
jgi:BT1 family